MSLKKLADVILELRDETGAKCLRELSFVDLGYENRCDDIFMTVPGCHSSVCVSGKEIKMQEGHDGFLKSLVRLRITNGLQEMIELLEEDLRKFKIGACEHKHMSVDVEDGYCPDCESFSEERE